MPDKSGLSGTYARAPQTLLFPILKEKDNSALASSPVRIRGCPKVCGSTRTMEVLTFLEAANELGCTEYA